MRCRRHLRHSAISRRLRPGDQGRLAHLHFGRSPSSAAATTVSASPMRGIAPHIDGNVGIIHIDRHIDIQEKDMDERMHTTPWFWTTHEGTVTTIATTATCTTSGCPTAIPRIWSSRHRRLVRQPARNGGRQAPRHERSHHEGHRRARSAQAAEIALDMASVDARRFISRSTSTRSTRALRRARIAGTGRLAAARSASR